MRTQLQLRVEQSKQLHVEVPPGDSPLQRSFALPGKQFILRKECCRLHSYVIQRSEAVEIDNSILRAAGISSQAR
jgi:hypothetical protein